MIIGLILAAGSSTRLGRPKQLLPLGDGTVIWHVTNMLLQTQVDKVVVVTGNRGDDVAAAIADLDATIVYNSAYASGQASSLVGGVRACERHFQQTPHTPNAILVLLADQPAITAETVDAVISRWNQYGAPVVQATYAGTRSHPVLFDASVIPHLIELQGDEGARGVIRQFADRVDLVETGVSAVPPDIDTESDYQRVLDVWNDPSRQEHGKTD